MVSDATATGQLMCEQIRQYTIGILSMDARYMSPEEVIPTLPIVSSSPSLGYFHTKRSLNQHYWQTL